MNLSTFFVIQIIFMVLFFTISSAEPVCSITKQQLICTSLDQDVVLTKNIISSWIGSERITNVTLKNCRITELGNKSFEINTPINYIDLSFNKIQRLNPGAFDGLNALTQLNLSNNLIKTLPKGVFDQNPNLKYLDLKFNKINYISTNVFKLLSNLVQIDFSNNELFGSDLNPSNNKSIFRNNPKVKYLDFSGNNMSETWDYMLVGLKELEYLNLDNCSLKDEIPNFVAQASSVKYLILSRNEINKVSSTAFQNFDNLDTLDLAFNAINELEDRVFADTKKLRIIALRYNKLRTLPETLFTNLASLANVDLSYNLIEYIPVNGFRGTAIKNLNLSHNRFSYLEANFCLELKNSGVNINKFYFNDNPWQCACLNEILKEVKKFSIRYNSNKFNGETPVCVTTNAFVCKRQMSENVLFNDMYQRREN